MEHRTKLYGGGIFIFLDKIINEEFEKYDDIYTPALRGSASAKKLIKPEAKYLCGQQKGTWDKFSYMYKK